MYMIVPAVLIVLVFIFFISGISSYNKAKKLSEKIIYCEFSTIPAGIEVKGGKLLKMLRFYAIVDSEAQVNGMLQILGSYLMPLDSKLESSKAFEKIGNAYLMSLSSTERAVIVKEDNYAFSVSLNTINGYDMVVLDIIPLTEADTYVFQDVI